MNYPENDTSNVNDQKNNNGQEPRRTESSTYAFPPITLLTELPRYTEDTEVQDRSNTRWITELLAGHGVQAHVIEIHHGPAVTRFEMKLEDDATLKDRIELQDKLARDLSVSPVRIEILHPGKRQFAVEIPNHKTETVTLREVLTSEEMRNTTLKRAVVLGKNTSGNPVICDPAKNFSYLLLVGQTASGKTVCLHSFINSLLFRASPDEVRLLLIDPKKIEFQSYNGIPHLLAPVVTDPRKALAALKWAIRETKDRHRKFKAAGAYEIDAYNSQMKETGGEPLPEIFIIIDEITDLWITDEKGEEIISALAESTALTGVRLIIATSCTSDARTARLYREDLQKHITLKLPKSEGNHDLHEKAAEQLLGWGDMLYATGHPFFPARIQGCFISEEEIDRVTTYIKEKNQPAYDTGLMNIITIA